MTDWDKIKRSIEALNEGFMMVGKAIAKVSQEIIEEEQKDKKAPRWKERE